LRAAGASDIGIDIDGGIMTVFVPLLVGVLYVCVGSLIREPYRRRFNAIKRAWRGPSTDGGIKPEVTDTGPGVAFTLATLIVGLLPD
jgi:hypothetical protein